MRFPTIAVILLLATLVVPIFPAWAGDVAEGKKVAKRICSGCHRFGPRFMRMNHGHIGPSFEGGIYGRKIGQDSNFSYSKAMKKASKGGMTWNDENLDRFLASPKDFFETSKMSFFRGVEDPDDRANLIAFLKTL